ncbi:MAG: hypothetical protein ACTHW2_08010 [Tissierella sp.]
MRERFIELKDKGKLVGVGTIQDILAKAPNCKTIEELYLHLSENGEENE